MSPTKVKICGITRPEDAIACAELGVDAIGLVFYQKSPRNLSVGQARDIIDVLPPFVKVVSLFMNAPAGDVLEVLDRVPVDLLQFHGQEAPDYCAGFGRPYIKAIPMGHLSGDNLSTDGRDETEWVNDYAAAHPHSAGFLLDSHALGKAGGTGEAFDWSLVPQDVSWPLILAGGLHPDNVEQAVRAVRPYAVDISSGVESAPGIKDRNKIEAFMRGVRSGQ